MRYILLQKKLLVTYLSYLYVNTLYANLAKVSLQMLPLKLLFIFRNIFLDFYRHFLVTKYQASLIIYLIMTDSLFWLLSFDNC